MHKKYRILTEVIILENMVVNTRIIKTYELVDTQTDEENEEEND